MESIIEKIKKLQAKAQSSTDLGNIEEANAFAMKATELMLKHAVDSELLKEKPIVKVGCVKIPLEVIQKKKEGQWGIALYNVISEFNFGSIILHEWSGTISLIANMKYIPIIQNIAESLTIRLREVCKVETSKMRKLMGPNFNPNAFARAFLDGAVIGINKQLKEQRKKHIVEYSTLSMILTNNEADLKAYIDTQWSKLETKAAPNYGSIQGKIRGIEVGKSISIHSGVNITKGSTQHLLS